MRIGWVIASRMPAMPLASVWRAAKPMTRPSTAEEASRPVAMPATLGDLRRGDAPRRSGRSDEDEPPDQPQAGLRRPGRARRA